MRSSQFIAPVILAAGDSTRMGHPKALLPLGNRTFLTSILETLQILGLAKPLVVLGKAADIIAPEIGNYSVSILINPDPDRGQLSSIQTGIAGLEARAQAAMIWPVDQPAVSGDLVRRLAQAFVDSKCRMAFPKYLDKRGHPAILHRSVFGEFLEASPEGGGKHIVQRHLQDILELAAEEPGVVEDIDTPSDYEALTGETLQYALARRNI